jgi:hypothetical protein
MQIQISLLVVVACCIALTSSFRLPTIQHIRTQKLPELKVKANNAALIAYSTFLASTPTIATAEDGGNTSLVLVPLIVSFLTIGPFLYYQQ